MLVSELTIYSNVIVLVMTWMKLNIKENNLLATWVVAWMKWNIFGTWLDDETEPFRTWAIMNKKSIVVLNHIVTDNLADYEC